MALHLNIRMVMMFFIAAALLNLVNYTIYSLQAQNPKHHPLKMTVGNTPRFTTTTSTTTSTTAIAKEIWDAFLTCTTSLTSSPKTTRTAKTFKPGTTSRTQTPDDSYNSFEYTDSTTVKNSVTSTPVAMCPAIPPGLGPVTPGDDLIESISNTTFGEIFHGGYFKTNECKPHESVAIIVPHRGDKKHLNIFLHYLHSFMIKQQSEYQIFIVENTNHSEPLNRGQLFNIGFTEIQRHSKDWPCIILHEAYLMPVDTRNLYRCSWYPRQLVAAVEKHHTLLRSKVGGVIAIRPQLYKKVNGFSNIYHKSGAEYSYFYRRILSANYTVERSDLSIGRYKYIKLISMDDVSTPTPTTTMSPTLMNSIDGLSTLSYKVNQVDHLKLYTHINIDADPTEQYVDETTVGQVKKTSLQFGNLKQAVP